MAVWTVALAAAVALFAFLLLTGGEDEPSSHSSRFQPIHIFQTADYHALAFHLSGNGKVFFGHHNGLQVSRDGGLTWQPVVDEENWDAMNVAFDPFDHDTIYVAGHEVFFKSDDGGESWREIDANLPSLDLHTFGVSPSIKGRLYAAPAGMGLYQSDDGGSTWTLVSDAPAGSHSIVELQDGSLLLGSLDRGILRSDDGGATWTDSRTGIETGAIYSVRGVGSGLLYAGTDHGVYVSRDGGRSWNLTGMGDAWIVALGVDPSNPSTVLAVSREGALYRSEDEGASW